MRLFDIQRFSVHDGPGIRTSVFLKGCPLRCRWCHNPESVLAETQILYYTDKCTGCGNCVPACPNESHRTDCGIHLYDRKFCDSCGRCAAACPHGALKIAGYDISADELLDKILRDRIFYDQTGGGVTFTGGEPLMQVDALKDIAKLAKQAGVHTAIETSLLAAPEAVEALSDSIDLWICDVKAYSSEFHKRCTGTGNAQILDNFWRLSQKAPEKMWVRIPVIPEANDSNAEFMKIADLLKGNTYDRIELMPYHDIGVGKYTALGIKYALRDTQPPENGQIKSIRDIFKRKGIDVYLPD